MVKSVICVDLESLIKQLDGCKNNLEKSFTAKVGEHITSGYLMSTFAGIKNNYNV